MVTNALNHPPNTQAFLQRGQQSGSSPKEGQAPRSQDRGWGLQAERAFTEFILCVPNLHMRKLKHREVGDLLQVSQPLGDSNLGPVAPGSELILSFIKCLTRKEEGRKRKSVRHGEGREQHGDGRIPSFRSSTSGSGGGLGAGPWGAHGTDGSAGSSQSLQVRPEISVPLSPAVLVGTVCAVTSLGAGTRLGCRRGYNAFRGDTWRPHPPRARPGGPAHWRGFWLKS